MIAVIIIIVIVTILAWLVFTPVVLIADSSNKRIEIRQLGTFRFSWTPGAPAEFAILGFRKMINTREAEHKQKEPAKKRRLRKSPESWLFLVRGCLKGVSLRKLVLNLDTGDVVLNAQLVPAMVLLSSRDVNLSTNFSGVVYLHMEIEARLNKLLWTGILFLTKK
jgi:hypothetical protein